MTGYELSKAWFKWCKANRPLINPNHHALYFWIIEKANSFEWCPSFGLPSDDAMHHLGINSYKTYIRAFDDLEKFGFIEVIERSKNQYTCNIIALVEFTEALTKAHTKAKVKAPTKASPKQSEYNKTFKLLNLKTLKPFIIPPKEKKEEIEIKPEVEKKQGFNLAAQEREQNPIKPHELTSLTIEQTKERFLLDNGLFELFVRATKLERKNFDKAIEIFIKHTIDKIEYPRSYEKGDDNSKKHFKFWFVKLNYKEFEISEPLPIIPKLSDDEIKLQQQLGRDKQDAFTEKLRLKKIENDRQEDEKRESNKTGLRKISSNLSAQSVPSYLLSGA